MNRPYRYTGALVAASGVTAGVARTGQSQSLHLLLATFLTVVLASAVLLRYPALLWGRKTDDRAAAAVFAGGTSFGVMSLGYGVGETFQVGAAVLGFGLALLGMATGAWMADERQ